MPSEESRIFYETVARYYDAENAFLTEDLAFYGDLAAGCEGAVLDVGSGTGRVVLFLAGEEGVPATGIEFSAEMLARARRRLAAAPPEVRERVSLVEGNALDAQLDGRFDLILVSYHTFMHIRTQAEQLALLARCREWLTPDGLLVIDLPNVGDLFGSADDGSVVLERTFVEPESGHLVMQQSVSTLDRAEQLMYITWIYDEIEADGVVRRLVAPLTLHYYFPAEMDLLLRVAGLERAQYIGDYDGSPFVDGCPRMITLARVRLDA